MQCVKHIFTANLFAWRWCSFIETVGVAMTRYQGWIRPHSHDSTVSTTFSSCLTTSSLSSSLVEDLIFVNCHCAVITHSLYLSLTFTHPFYFPYLHHLFRPSLVSLFFFLASSFIPALFYSLFFSSLFLCSYFSLPLVLPSHLNTTQWLRQQRQRQRQEQW